MAFHSPDYDTYAILGDPAAEPLWHWSSWQRAMANLDAVVQSARGPAALRSTQFLPNRAGTVKFGRIGWKERDQQKWTHGSPLSAAACADWQFLSAELWAPAWTQCGKEQVAPDVFLSVLNEEQGARNLAFNPVVVLAVVSDLAERISPTVADTVDGLRRLMRAHLVGFQRRPWGRTVGGFGFTNAIQDLHVTGLFKAGEHHNRSIDLELFAESWVSVAAVGTAP